MKPKSQSFLRELLRNELSKCVKCGSCMAFCPVFRHQTQESSTMRGKIALLQALEEGRELPEAKIAQILSRCLGCLNCKNSCPNGVDVSRLSILARLLLSRGKFSDWHGAALDAGYHFRMFRKISLLALPLAIHKEKALGSTKIIKSIFRRFVDSLSKNDPPNLDLEGKTIVFPGCVLEQNSERLGNLLKVVSALAPGVVIAKNLGCCATPVLGIPDFSLHSMIVKKLFLNFKRAKPARILVACPTCLYGFRYLSFLYDLSPDESRILEISGDLYSFLSESDWKPKNRISGSYTFHDPCHQARGLGIFSAPRVLLKKALHETLRESYKEGSCCGFGGIFTIRHPAISAAIREQRVEQLLKTGAETTITSCWTCLESLGLPLSQKGAKTLHILDLLAKVV
ncbi:(Fe-S)-binding protein [bacterium]|nr:(Fe-S)-binding protein [bacterium]